MRRLSGDIYDAGMVRDPLSQGTGIVTAIGRSPVYFEEGDADFIDGQIIIHISGQNNELFKKLKGCPLRAQLLPLVWETKNPEDGGFIQMKGLSRFQTVADEDGEYIEILGSFRYLDNLQFLDAVQNERLKYKEVGDRDGQQ